MAEEVEGGAVIAWRLLATLEGGSLLLATSALLAYTLRKRLSRLKRTRRPINTVMLTSTTDTLGQELKSELEARGCVVRLARPLPGAIRRMSPDDIEQVDALVIVGAQSAIKPFSLESMADLVAEDVYNNLRLLESLSVLVKRGGCIAWACAGASADGSFRGAGDAFDTVLETNLQRVAQLSECEAVWVGRGENGRSTAHRLISALLTTERIGRRGYSIRNAAHKAGNCIGRWLKIVT